MTVRRFQMMLDAEVDAPSRSVRGGTLDVAAAAGLKCDVIRVLDALTSSTQVRPVSQTLAEQAWEWLRRHDERKAQALAFDGDFSAAGFVELR